MTDNDLQAQLQSIERKLDRALNELEFVKHRTATYLGDNVGLTYLVDETPVYVNTDDFGCPANFINGGRYEEEYISILRSFRKPRSVFLDIGANLGVFSLRLAPMLRHGRIFAFEPNPRIHDLFARSSFLGGFDPTIRILPFGASDSEREVSFHVPRDHAGGGAIGSGGASDGDQFTIQVKRLDDWLPQDLRVDIVKIDVEGHELAVLRGMQRILDRSPSVAVLFEKLGTHTGIEADICALLEPMGLKLHLANGTRLEPVTGDSFAGKAGYFLATREDVIHGELERDFVNIFGVDLNLRHGALHADDRYVLDAATVSEGEVFFYGPYWYLARGTYRIELIGELSGQMRLELTERFGFGVQSFLLGNGRTAVDVAVHRDLTKFELVGRSAGSPCALQLERIKLTRLG
ncbi:FkbM family methyltransferase [Piscinibacter sakaiensis]|uniref:FkbM family methyltransferase n=1 Tax=Piscinibacter sakaiensis TaxID=1547922 RepID=UPI003AAED0DF